MPASARGRALVCAPWCAGRAPLAASWVPGAQPSGGREGERGETGAPGCLRLQSIPSQTPAERDPEVPLGKKGGPTSGLD